jgi:hypothetical protein
MEIRLKYNGNKIDIKRVIYPYFYFISPNLSAFGRGIFQLYFTEVYFSSLLALKTFLEV